MPVKPIPGQPSSERVRAELAAAGQPVLLAFSRGKDSIAAWLAMREAGVQDVVPYHLYGVPGLEFQQRDLARWEAFFGTKILNLPHSSFYGQLNALALQTPDRAPNIIAAQIPDVDATEYAAHIREITGHPDAWIADGVRAADSPQRRVAFADHGVWRAKHKKVSPVWDWTKAELMACLDKAGARLPVDYDWFDRSHDGIDARFTAPLRDHAPADYERTKSWFPLVDVDILRQPLVAAERARLAGIVKTATWRERKAAEAARFKLATDGNTHFVLTFDDPDQRADFLNWLPTEHTDGYVNGHQLRDALAIQPGFRLPRHHGMTAVQRRIEDAWYRTMRARNPLADLNYSGDIEKDSRAELEALHASFTEPEPWVCLYFLSRDAKGDFLADAGITATGEQFAPGPQVWNLLRKAKKTA